MTDLPRKDDDDLVVGDALTIPCLLKSMSTDPDHRLVRYHTPSLIIIPGGSRAHKPHPIYIPIDDVKRLYEWIGNTFPEIKEES